jgi:hypothetical protein
MSRVCVGVPVTLWQDVPALSYQLQAVITDCALLHVFSGSVISMISILHSLLLLLLLLADVDNHTCGRTDINTALLFLLCLLLLTGSRQVCSSRQRPWRPWRGNGQGWRSWRRRFQGREGWAWRQGRAGRPFWWRQGPRQALNWICSVLCSLCDKQSGVWCARVGCSDVPLVGLVAVVM